MVDCLWVFGHVGFFCLLDCMSTLRSPFERENPMLKFPGWRSSAKVRRGTKRRSPRGRPFRLSFEALEDRLALATDLVITSVLPDIRAGDMFNVQVQAVNNPGGTPDNAFVGVIQLNAAAAGGSDFSSVVSQTAVNGQATFNVFLRNAADNYTVTATSAGLAGDDSNPFTVTFSTVTVAAISGTPVANNVVAGATST